MSEPVAINEDGVLAIDMAKADALWRSLDPLKQAELTNVMFEPVLKKAKEQANRIEELEAKLEKALGALELLHGDLVHAWPSVVDLGPVANARAVIAELKGQNDE